MSHTVCGTHFTDFTEVSHCPECSKEQNQRATAGLALADAVLDYDLAGRGPIYDLVILARKVKEG